jgi:hypothetical protein
MIVLPICDSASMLLQNDKTFDQNATSDYDGAQLVCNQVNIGRCAIPQSSGQEFRDQV